MTVTRRQFAAASTLLGMAAYAGGCRWPAGPVAGDLYTAQTFVTGQSEESVAPHLDECLADVLVKLSGDPSIASDPGLAAYGREARSYVTGMSFRDYMEGIPIGDEQGTRDRAYFVKVAFAPDKIDAVLRALGRKPWTDGRPLVVPVFGVRNHARDYVLTADGEWGVDQRDALADAAWKMGLGVALPAKATPGIEGLSFDKIAGLPAAEAAVIAARVGGALCLVGTLAFADGAKGWASDFRLEHGGGTHRWAIGDVNFDTAFRVAMGGVLQILSGHGSPA